MRQKTLLKRFRKARYIKRVIEANYTPFSKTKEVKDSLKSKMSQKGSY